ncbi:MAG: N-6 DNA methylase [Candidatus Jorgensenbacteria bacterium]
MTGLNEQDRKFIEKLIRKYEALTPVQRKGYNESMTCKDFILPLFQTLGWDVFNHVTQDEVTSETQVSGKRVDYAFHLNGTTSFFLEAKKFSVDLREERWAEQAVMYAWHKGVSWAVLTDFQSIKVFNAEWDEPDPEQNLLFEISYRAYLSDDRLLLLSRELMGKGLLDKYADENFKKPKREPVDKQLAKDLVRWRETLFKNLKGWNSDKPLTDKHIAESVQRILDRFIFIRTTEDRGIEDKHLQELVRNYRESKKGFDLIEELKKLFKNYDGWYNSKLFEHDICDTLEYENDFLAEVIEELYKNRKGIRYDFSSINADVLGSIYEQYLGYIQQIEGKEGKRKEQGIFYTPRYIVGYIIQNTLGELLKNKPLHEALTIKVLDPACGSGSFLLSAFEKLDEYITRKGSDSLDEHLRRFLVLTSNIYGVDLDPEATEIAQLNLLLKVVDRKEKLPNLTNNIECGNSLIEGKDELKRYFSADWRSKKPFNWRETFNKVFEQGGFDVVIGNPPYIRNRELDPKEKEFFSKIYSTAKGQYDIYQLFFERSIELLKDGGYLGFITSNKYAIADYGKKLREFILERCKIISIVDVSNLKVFKDASTYPYVIILQKDENNAGHMIKAYRPEDETNLLANEFLINQDEWRVSTNKDFVIRSEVKFLKKIEGKSVELGKIAVIKETIHTGNIRTKLIVDKKIDDNCKKLLAGKDCHRYWFKWGGKYLRYDRSLIDKKKGDYANLVKKKYFEDPKILLREIAERIECCFDDEKYFTLNKVYSVQSSEYDLMYLIALLNSKLLTFYFRNRFEGAHVQGGFLQFKKMYTSQIPIYQIDKQNKEEKLKYDELVKFSRQMVTLNEELQKLDPILDKEEYLEKKDEIEKTDRKIDEAVYKLYNLTPEEIVRQAHYK